MDVFAHHISAAFSTTLAISDSFLSRALNPSHMDPLSSADPFLSRLLRVDNGDDGGGGDEGIKARIEERVRVFLGDWPSRRTLAQLRWMKEPALEALESIGRDERRPMRFRNDAVSALAALAGMGALAPLTRQMLAIHSLDVLGETLDGETSQTLRFVLEECLRDNQEDDPEAVAQFARLLSGLILLEEGLNAFHEALSEVSNEKISSVALMGLSDVILRFQDSLKEMPFSGSSPEEWEAGQKILYYLHSALNNEDGEEEA